MNPGTTTSRAARAINRPLGLALAAVAAALTVGTLNHSFLSASSIAGLLSSTAPIIILSVGVGLVVITGEIDISVGAMFGTLAALLATLASPSHANLPAWASVAIVIAAGALAGLANGAITVYGKIPSIVATLGTMSILRGLTELILGGTWITDLPPQLRALGTGSFLGFSLSTWAAATVAAAAVFLARRTRAGLSLYAVGDHADAARLSRVNIATAKLLAFTTSGALVGVAVAFAVPQLSVVESNLGLGMELSAVTAIVVGGISIRGGRGTLLGVVLAAVLLGMVRSVLVYLKLGPAAAYWEQAIHGACILAAVLGDRAPPHQPHPDTHPARPPSPLPIAAALVAVLLAAWWTAPEFMSPSIQAALLSQIAEVALLAVPMTLVVLTGGIDLSVGSTMALSAVVAGIMHERGVPTSACLAGAIGTGALCGWLNGLFITRARVHPLVATLATLALYRGLAEGVSGGRPISGFPDLWTNLGAARIAGLPAVLMPAIAAAALAAVMLTRTTRGLDLYATGMNETAARYAGVPVDRLKSWAYTLAGTAAGIAACLFIARRNTAKADIATGIELEVITACVLGGVSLVGGRGRIVGVALGVALIHEIRQFVAWKWSHDELIQIVLGAALVTSALPGLLRPALHRSNPTAARGMLDRVNPIPLDRERNSA